MSPIERSKFARKQKNHRIKKNLNPIEHAKYKANQANWRAKSQDKIRAWRKIDLARLKAERHDLKITYEEQRFYSKLVTALFRAQVEW